MTSCHTSECASPATAERREAERRGAVEELRAAAREFAEGEWAEAWGIDGVDDDVSAVRSTERWFNRYADRLDRDGGGR